MKKNTPNTNQLPKDPQGQRFIAWFPHRWNFIEADYFDTNYRHTRDSVRAEVPKKPNWRTETKYPIEPVVLWHRWKDKDDLIGVSFDSETRYGLADIDRDSPIHPYNDEKAFQEWLSSFESIGLAAYVIIRSSFSEGLHIYFPLPKLTSTFNLACALALCAETTGTKVKSGELEFFPNTKSYSKYQPTAYKAHRLPLQPHTGSVILDLDLNPIGDSTELFCDQMEWAAARQDMDALEVACNVAREIINFRRRGSRNLALLANFKRDLEIIFAEGWTDFRQTNFILGKIAAYGMIFTDYTGKELEDFIVETAKSCDGYEKYCCHKHEIRRRARDYAKSAERYYWKPGTECSRTGTYKQHFSKPTNPNHNQEIALSAQDRIVEGLKKLLQAGIDKTVTGIIAFRDALRAEIKKLYGVFVSISTLMKYRSLWHPKDKGIVLGTIVPIPENREPEPEIVSVETSQIDEKINEPISPVEVQKNTTQKSSKRSQDKGGTDLPPKTLKYKTLEPSQIKGGTDLPLYEGFCRLNVRVGDRFLYLGKGTCGLIRLSKYQFPQIRTIEPNEIVKLVSIYHGSDLRDEPPLRKIVYVQPIEQALLEQWKDEQGIAVFLDELEKLKLKSKSNQIKNQKSKKQ